MSSKYQHPSFGEQPYSMGYKEQRPQIKGAYDVPPNTKSKPADSHDISVIKDLLKAILNTLDEQRLTLESHSEVLDELSELLLSDDD